MYRNLQKIQLLPFQGKVNHPANNRQTSLIQDLFAVYNFRQKKDLIRLCFFLYLDYPPELFRLSGMEGSWNQQF
jgi:hypothetical protein